jgi:hypothetical protein
VRQDDIEVQFHIVPASPERPGCGAGGAGVTEVRLPVTVTLAASIKLTGYALPVALPLLMVHFVPARRVVPERTSKWRWHLTGALLQRGGWILVPGRCTR